MINRLPVAETFHSIQGEGTYIGTPMHFVRLAGCPVGFKATEEAVTALSPGDHEVIPVLQSGQRGSLCKTWDGRRFTCDTDFSCHTYKTVDELIGETHENHICLTGGEPLIHQKALLEAGFFQQAFARKIDIHIETSGTVMLDPRLKDDFRIWVTVAPKWNYLEEMIMCADEIKLLIDENFSTAKVSEILQWIPESLSQEIYICPINEEKTVNQKNVDRCMEILKTHPDWKLSVQLHKFLGLR
jgi:7-carboxy-7-deazaguanine synthase